MTGRIKIFSVAVVLLMGSTAWAADIFTPPLNLGNGSASGLICAVLNTGSKKAVDVTITIRDQDNNIRGTLTDSINPGEIQVVGDDNPSNTEYCVVSGIPKRHARVTLCVLDVNGICTVTATAP